MVVSRVMGDAERKADCFYINQIIPLSLAKDLLDLCLIFKDFELSYIERFQTISLFGTFIFWSCLHFPLIPVTKPSVVTVLSHLASWKPVLIEPFFNKFISILLAVFF